MALENQISMYSVDTSNFYSTKERKLHRRIMRLKVQRNKIKEVKDILRDYLLKAGFTEDNLKPIERGKYSSIQEFELFETVDLNKDKTQIQVKRVANRKGSYKILSQVQRGYILTSKIRCIKLRVSIFDEKPVYRLRYILKLPVKEISSLDLETVFNTYEYYCKLYRYKQVRTGETKQELLKFLKKKIEANEAAIGKSKHHIRVLNENTLSDKDVICVFESALNRYIGLKKDEFTESLMVVQVYFFDVFKDIEKYGFLYKGEKYRYLTSSAGQIRTKKAVFIKESVWNRLEKTLMCGLTVDAINAKGGNNVN